MNRIFRSGIFYLILIIAVVWIFNVYRQSAEKPTRLDSVNEFEELVERGEIASAKFLSKDEKVVGELTGEGQRYEVYLPHDTIDEYSKLAISNKVAVTADP